MSSTVEQGHVERFAFEVGRLSVEHDLVSDMEETDPGGRRDVTEDELASAILAAARFTSHYRPVSLVGAMFQVMLAASDLDNIKSFVPDDKRTHQFCEMVKDAERRLRGVIDYLEQRSCVPLAQVGGDFFYGRTLDPFAVTDPGSIKSQTCDRQIHATTPTDGPVVHQPAFASVEEQLLAYNARYIELEALFHEASDIEEANGQGLGLAPDTASSTALRIKRQLHRIICGTRATTLRELGLKARIAADLCSDFWDGEDNLEEGERLCRSVLEDLLSSSGVTRIPTRDVSVSEIRERALTGEWPERPVGNAVSASPIDQVD